MKPLPRLYAIADASFGDPVRLAETLFRAGVRLLQVRNKVVGAGQLLEQVESIVQLAPQDAEVIVNDRVDVALIAGAGGVHLGQTDLPVEHARTILGPERTVGFSTHNVEQARQADQFSIDYIAVGPIFATTTKQNADPVLGLDNLARICEAVKKPVVAIGGIELERVPDVLNAGAASVAVIRGLLHAEDIERTARQWLDAAGM